MASFSSAQRDAGPQIAAQDKISQDFGQLTTLPPPQPSADRGRRSASVYRLEQKRQLLGLVRAVGIHLDEDVVVAVDASNPARYAAPRPSLPRRCIT